MFSVLKIFENSRIIATVLNFITSTYHEDKI